jgi:xylulokinase
VTGAEASSSAKASSSAEAILAVDLGTTEIKLGLMTADGRSLGTSYRPYPLVVDASTGCAEQDPGTWWSAFVEASHELVGSPSARTAPTARIVAICAVGQGPTLVPIDEAGRATHPAITWMDGRPATEAPELERATGLSGWGLGILAAARWLERNAPVAADRTRWYLNSWEWLAFRLTGEAHQTRSLDQVLPDRARAAGTGLAVERVPSVIDAGSILGRLTGQAATELGLPAGTPVVAGMVDSFASFHGAGLTDAGEAVDTGGTSGGLGVYWNAPVEVPGSWVAAAPLPGRWIVGGAMSATGKALDWLGDLLGGVPAETLIREAATIEPGAGGLVFLPYLAGERSPLWDSHARGAFVGLTLAHGRAHLARAVLEAAALALRHVAAPILAAGLRIDELVVTGGTARGDTWNAIKADVLGVPVVVPAARETAVVGAAILAATAIGWHADTVGAIEEMVRIDHRLEPDPRHRATYDALFEAYVALWPAVAPMTHRLGELPPSR